MTATFMATRLAAYAALLGLTLSAFSGEAAHQKIKTSAKDDREILVIGDRQREERVSNFIRAIVKPSREDQYASFQGRICPVAMGLPDEHLKVIEARMLDVAKAADIKTGKAGCDANMAVVVVHDTKDFFAELRREYPRILDGISIPERNRLINENGPAYAWQAIAARGAHGYGGADSSAIMALGAAEHVPSGNGLTFTNSTSANKGARTRTTRASNSRINRSVRFDINLAVVLIEKSALEGVTLRQVGDYSLMRLLGHTQDVKFEDIEERSILSLFTDRAENFDPPESVTAWDMAFMKSMYKAKGAKSAARQRSAMAKTFDKELVKWAQEK